MPHHEPTESEVDYLRSGARFMGHRTVLLEFKFTRSRAGYTRGQRLCALYENGSKITSAREAGLDLRAVCLANWLTVAYGPELETLAAGARAEAKADVESYQNTQSGGYLGLVTRNFDGRVFTTCDGQYGFGGVERIANALGIVLQCLSVTEARQVWLAHDERRERST